MEKQTTIMGEELEDKNPNDDVYTPEPIAKAIIEMFKPQGKLLEPCKGKGAFLKFMPNADWCEITEGRDFFKYKQKVDWIITNPPYSSYDRFIEHSFEIAENIVFLVPLGKVFNSWERLEKIKKWGGLKKIWIIGTGNKCGFPFGFPCGAFYFKKGYIGASIEIVYGIAPVLPMNYSVERESAGAKTETDTVFVETDTYREQAPEDQPPAVASRLGSDAAKGD